jgi:hypothetical protein
MNDDNNIFNEYIYYIDEMNPKKQEFLNSYEIQKKRQTPSKMMTSLERYQVITNTMGEMSNILKDLKKDNFLSIKHRIKNLKRNLAIEIRKEVPDFQPKEKVPGIPAPSIDSSSTKKETTVSSTKTPE